MINFLKTRKGTYIFNIKEFGTFVINDKITITNESYGTHEYELHALPIKVTKKKATSTITHYVNSDRIIISVNDYNKKLKELMAKGYEGNDDYEFDNLDDEYAYKKFVKTWEVQYEHKEIDEIVPFNVNGLIYSEYKEIIPLYQLGGEIDNPICNMLISPQEALKEICKELEIEFYKDEEKISTKGHYIQNASHSGIKYAKMNGNYIFTKESYEKACSFRGTYEECVAKLKEYKGDIKKIIKNILFVEENKLVSKSERKILIQELTDIYDRLYKVESMRKTQAVLSNAINKLKTTIQSLKEGTP
jgi:hypothetical protein